jgi:Xaa-Pro aminopeptidase
MNSTELSHIQEAIRGEALDGWLFCNFHHRDKLSDAILRINPDSTNSRLWIYAVPAEGEPLRIVHAVEPDHLDILPGQKISYISREDLLSALKLLAGKRWGVHISETLTAISYLDGGTAATFEAAGLRLVSAGGLVQRFKGLLDAPAIASLEKAASGLYDIVEIAWDIVRGAYADKRPLREGELRQVILDQMERRGLVTDHLPIVAAGANAGNPHYDFSDAGALIKEGDVIQFDLWAKERTPGAIYGDISWLGVFGPSASGRVEEAFGDLLDAREGAYHFIEAEMKAGRRPSGDMVDRKTREILINRGYGEALKHRTGHGIDTECHGSGVNIDSVEFPDSRPLLDGSCFSLEPGIYFSDFGLRTEIDVYIQEGKPVISQGNRRQFSLLTCPEGPC